ncbi:MULTISPECIES: hypothetical protein [unclassified Bartonella]
MTKLGIVFDAYQIEVAARTQAKKRFRYNPEKKAVEGLANLLELGSVKCV